jgi:hypothetical protein
VKALNFPHVLSAFYDVVVFAVSEDPSPYIGVFDFLFDSTRYALYLINIAHEVIVEDKLRRISIMLVTVFGHYASLFVDFDVFAVDVERGETPLVALLLLAVVSGSHNADELFFETLVE